MSNHIVSNGYPGNSEVNDEDLEAATFHNNHIFVSEWLKRFTRDEKNKEIRRKRCGSLLRRASYCHSVDVVKCILPPGSCEGEACKHPHISLVAPENWALRDHCIRVILFNAQKPQSECAYV